MPARTTRPTSTVARMLACAALVTALAGCTSPASSGQSGPTPSATPTPTAPPATPLARAGSTFDLITVDAGPFNAAAVQGAFGPTTLELTGDDGLRGTADCRSFTGSYEPAPADDASSAAPGEAIRITGLEVDEGACEQGYVGLGDIVSFIESQTFVAVASGDHLTLTSLDGQYALDFARQ